MFFNYLKTAIRNFQREKFFTFINLAGLSFGLAVSLCIFLYIYHENSYDKFHNNSDRIYRMAMHLALGGKEGYINASHPALASAIKEDIPYVEGATRVEKRNGYVFKNGEKVFDENDIYLVDQDFLTMFSFNWLYGDRGTAMAEPNTVILTPELAKRYFDEEPQDVLGKDILINQKPHKVTGIIDLPPSGSHIKYRALVSLKNSSRDKDTSWDNINLSTYVMVAENSGGDQLLRDVQSLFESRSGYDPEMAQGLLMEYLAQPLEDIHLRSQLDGEFESNGNINNLYLFLAIGLVILVLACVNFMNLSTARSIQRSKEVGIRKVLGSSKASLRVQFLFESTLITVISMFLALGITELLRLPLSAVVGVDIHLVDVMGFREVAILVLLTLGVGLAAGSYPAFFLSAFRPVDVLKGKGNGRISGQRLRNMLVVMQFVISCTLITATILFNQQVSFLREKSLGFDKENLIEVGNLDDMDNQESFLDRLNTLNGVSNSSLSVSGPIDDYDGTQMHRPEDQERLHLVNMNRINDTFLTNMGMKITEGRNFNRDLASDSIAIILNQTAADMIFQEDPVGKELMFKGGNKRYQVVGVVDDFNFESLRKSIMPLVFFYNPIGYHLQVRLEAGNYTQTIASISELWREYLPDTPFNYYFVDEKYEQLYQSEMRTGQLISGFTLIAIMIACLGLLGLAAYMAEKRNKEIGIRKALGATETGIISMLSMDFVRIVGIGFILSIPITYYLIREWLTSYAYKIDPGVVAYTMGGLIAMVLALGTISFQAYRAARENPVRTLRSE